MPWNPEDAERHTKKASTPKARRMWAHVANNVLDKTGDDVRAIRAADSTVARRKPRKLRPTMRGTY